LESPLEGNQGLMSRHNFHCLFLHVFSCTTRAQLKFFFPPVLDSLLERGGGGGKELNLIKGKKKKKKKKKKNIYFIYNVFRKKEKKGESKV